MTMPQTSRAPVTILVVDDEPRVCKILERLCREEGYRVVTAAGGRQALVLAAEAQPQLILLDIVMAQMDGIATLRELRSTGYAGTVIMLTGQGTLQTAREAMLLGAHDYVTKPFDLEFLKSVMRDGLWGSPEGQRASACAP